MKLDKAIATLEEIRRKYGNLDIVGGYLNDDNALSQICVINEEGVEIWPQDQEKPGAKYKIDGVFLS